MKRTSILASAGAVALGLSLAVCVVPAVAQGSQIENGPKVNINMRRLPKATWNVTPPEIQIINGGPRVVDCRDQESVQNYEIHIPAQAPAQTQTTRIVVPGGGTASGISTMSGGTPQTITIGGSRPFPARFGSNIPAGGVGAANSLPNGTTTNRLMGSNANAKGKMTPPPATIRPGTLLKKTNTVPDSTPTLTYKENAGSATGFAGNQKNVKTDVSGIIRSQIKRGDYLKPPQ